MKSERVSEAAKAALKRPEQRLVTRRLLSCPQLNSGDITAWFVWSKKEGKKNTYSGAKCEQDVRAAGCIGLALIPLLTDDTFNKHTAQLG